jgi:hypothetical protein
MASCYGIDFDLYMNRMAPFCDALKEVAAYNPDAASNILLQVTQVAMSKSILMGMPLRVSMEGVDTDKVNDEIMGYIDAFSDFMDEALSCGKPLAVVEEITVRTQLTINPGFDAEGFRQYNRTKDELTAGFLDREEGRLDN